MVEQRSVFRKVALDRLASPEQLDQLLPVSDARGWVALLAIGLVLVSAIVWSFVGSISQNVGGTGILVKSGGVLDITPVAGGQITDVAVAIGETVTEGQVVVRIAQPELSARLQQARAELASLRELQRQRGSFSVADMKLQVRNLAQQRAAVMQAIKSAESVARWTNEKIAIDKRLVEEGLLLKQNLLETQQKRHAALERIGAGRSQLAQIAVKELELRSMKSEVMVTSEAKIQEVERNVEDLSRELQLKTQVVTPYTGRILEVLAEQGALAEAGAPVMRLDLEGRAVRRLEAVLYVPSVLGKQIRSGMRALVAPSTVKQEEYGMMLAEVKSVSDFPVTAQGMHRVLKNERLVSALSGTDAPYEVHAELLVDPTTVSQYRWSSSRGPAQLIQSGTLVTASIAVADRRPVELVVPAIKRLVAP